MLKVAAIQTSLHWEDRDANLAMFSQKLNAIQGVDIIILPEMFATGFSMHTEKAEDAETGASIEWMKKEAAEKKTAICGSLMVKGGDAFYNRFYFIEPSGIVHTYSKRHLFSLAGEENYYKAGEEQVVVDYKGWKIALQVCYDLRFPVWSRRTGSYDYDLLMYVANWPERRSHAWKSLLPARAIENQSFVIGVNRVGYDHSEVLHSGDTAIIDPMGKAVARAKPFSEEIVTATLQKEKLDSIRKNLPFGKDADQFRL